MLEKQISWSVDKIRSASIDCQRSLLMPLVHLSAASALIATSR